MALTRKALATMGIEEDKIDQIIEMHTGVTSELKTELDKAKEDAEKLPSVQKELDELKATVEKNGEDAFKVKYEALKEDFEKYKQDQEEKEIHAQKEVAYRNILQEVGISDKRINAVLKVSDVDKLELDEQGNVKDVDGLKTSIGEEWADFIVTTETVGARTATPPVGNGKVYKTKDEIMSIRDTKERQQAIADNHDLFGF